MRKNGLSLHLSGEELAALINILSFAKAVFKESVERVTEDGDMESAKQLQDRVDTCTIFIDMLLKNMHIGEPADDTRH